MKSIYDTFVEFSKMKYTKNTIKESNHEIEVSKILEKNGFSQADNATLTKLSKDIIRSGGQNIETVDGRYYYFQPMGTHDVPDFIIVDNHVTYFLECKTGSKTDKVTWNTNLPKKDYIYLFSCEKYDSSTLFLGQHHLNETIYDIYKEGIETIRDIVKNLNKKLKTIDNQHGYEYYARNMFIQSGGGEKTSVIKHKNSEKYLLETLDFVLQKS